MVIPNLMKGFSIDQVQAEFVAEIKLRNLNREYILNRVNEIDKLRKEISELNDLLESDEKVKKVIVKQLGDIAKKYGRPRCTEIIHEANIKKITAEHLIEDYNLKVFLTEQNYLKKIPMTSLRNSAEHKLKDDDYIIQEIDARNKCELLLFSNKQAVYKLKLFEIEDCKTSNLGEYATNLLSLEEDEKIIYIVATEDYGGYMLFAFGNGKVAKIDVSSYITKTNRKRLANAYNAKSELIYISHIIEDEELVAFSNLNKVLIFDTAKINPKVTRTSAGVQVMRAKKGSAVIEIKKIVDVSFKDPKYYKTKNIPAVGYYLKEEDAEDQQLELNLVQ